MRTAIVHLTGRRRGASLGTHRLLADWTLAPDGALPTAQTGQSWTVLGTAAVHSGAVTNPIGGTSSPEVNLGSHPIRVILTTGPWVFGGVVSLGIWNVPPGALPLTDVTLVSVDSAGNWALSDTTAGTAVNLAAGVTPQSPAEGDVWQFDIAGQTITFSVNGTPLGSGTSTRPPSAGMALGVNTCGAHRLEAW